MNKDTKKTTNKNIYDEYRKILEQPELSDKEIEEARHNIRQVAIVICEHVWKKKFY